MARSEEPYVEERISRLRSGRSGVALGLFATDKDWWHYPGFGSSMHNMLNRKRQRQLNNGPGSAASVSIGCGLWTKIAGKAREVLGVGTG